MNAPTHIRFTHDESLAIDAYAEAHRLRKASAVRELLRLGLAASAQAAVPPPGLEQASELSAMSGALTALAHSQNAALQRIDARLQKLERASRRRPARR